MGDAAHVGSLDHEVYHTPFEVRPEFETWNTPDNYRRYPDGDKLPDKMKVWRVQNSGKTYGGVVARSYGFMDSPDAEALVIGFNEGKEYGAIGVGRQGSFLQWGYASPPSQMTEPGRRLFLNCVYYIHKFDGIRPLVYRKSSPRMDAVRLAPLINRISGDQKEFFLGQFPEALYAQYNSDPDGLTRLYRENLEWVYRDGVFRIDEELKSLGLETNRTSETLDRLIAMLDDESHAATARRLLKRYTDVSFSTSQQWRQWFDGNRDGLYFSDVGGYKFFVVPEGYPTSTSFKGG
ncbi:MAG: hypothetical protein JW741_23335 [Sedimentisphaerales bacterium]|nr:hypothetical protein [Sedimentisphaerales bacterium]